MNNLCLLILESTSMLFLIGLLIMIYGLRHAPMGFQHYHLFYYGIPPDTLIPIESPENTPPAPKDWC